MTVLIWTDDYSVGDGTIDNDHRGLFAAVNELEEAVSQGAGADEIGRIVAYLVRYVNEHFQREERLMKDCGYPDFEEHKGRHRRFSKKVYAIEQVFKADPASINLDGLVGFLRGWLVRHILGADRDFGPHLKAGPSGGMGIEDPGDGRGKDDMVSVDVEVPINKVAAIRGCAEILSMGGGGSDSIMAVVERTQILDLDEARKIVDDLLN